MRPSKLIVSRKGFDSTNRRGVYPYGGCPSPIFPDGTMYSLPIPGDDYEAPIYYSDLLHKEANIGEVVEELTRGRYKADDLAGVDPDIRQDALPREDGWRGLFGQAGSSQTHLQKQGVGVGDLFLFFGLYQRVEGTPNGWRYLRGTPKLHVLWGWLQIDQVCKVDSIKDDEEFFWATYHCHFSWSGDPSNTLYVAPEQLDLGDEINANGAGIFPRFHPQLVLTRAGGTASQWRLPRWFFPEGNKKPLSSHPRGLWQCDDDYAYVQRRGPGQEFVLDLEQYPEALDWASRLVRDFG